MSSNSFRTNTKAIKSGSYVFPLTLFVRISFKFTTVFYRENPATIPNPSSSTKRTEASLNSKCPNQVSILFSFINHKYRSRLWAIRNKIASTKAHAVPQCSSSAGQIKDLSLSMESSNTAKMMWFWHRIWNLATTCSLPNLTPPGQKI